MDISTDFIQGRTSLLEAKSGIHLILGSCSVEEMHELFNQCYLSFVSGVKGLEYCRISAFPLVNTYCFLPLDGSIN